jgi:hypothetical protein
MSQLSRGFENLADWRALARIGLGGIDLYCRSFVRPPQCIILDIDDIDDPSKNSPWCAVTATTAANPRCCCREQCAATTPSASPGTTFTRVETTHMGAPTCASSSPTFEGRGKALYEKCSGPTREPHRRHGVPDPVPACSRWQANQLPAHRLQLAAAQLEARRTEALAPAAATFETIRLTFVKIAARFAELKVVIKLPSRRHACGDDGRNHDAGPMIDTARAAARSHFNHKPRSDCRGGALFRRRARPTTMADRRGGGPCV